MAERVRCDEAGVVRTMPDGTQETVSWDDLEAVIILTTDEGPFRDDVFWLLKGSASGCAVPSETEGMSELMTRLQQLPGFDNDAVIRAMGSTDNATFLCWQRQD
jgi:hypothetical protein